MGFVLPISPWLEEELQMSQEEICDCWVRGVWQLVHWPQSLYPSLLDSVEQMNNLTLPGTCYPLVQLPTFSRISVASGDPSLIGDA